MTSFTVQPAEKISGDVKVPPDKSISHRAFLLAALAKGTTVVHHPLDSLDVRATMEAVKKLGAKITEKDGYCEIEGPGIDGLDKDPGEIDCGNSGTLMRLLCGVCVAGGVKCTLTGDESLSSRPMQRVVTPLLEMGADIRSNGGKPPLEIRPAKSLKGIHYKPPIASAQVKSAVLLAGLGAKGFTSVTEPALSRSHTEDMLFMFRCTVHRDDMSIIVAGREGPPLKPYEIHVPGDISSAAFFIVAGAAAREGQVLLNGVSFNPTRTGIIKIMGGIEIVGDTGDMGDMGASITPMNVRMPDNEKGEGESDCDLLVKASRQSLKGIPIKEELIPLAIDEFPAIFVAAALAEGDTVLRNATELRVKESDRIASMAAGLRTLGVQLEEYEDGIRISGNPAGFCGGDVDSFGDHRIAMALAIAGALGNEEVRVHNCDNVATSFPDFCTQCKNVGIDIKESEDEG